VWLLSKKVEAKNTPTVVDTTLEHVFGVIFLDLFEGFSSAEFSVPITGGNDLVHLKEFPRD